MSKIEKNSEIYLNMKFDPSAENGTFNHDSDKHTNYNEIITKDKYIFKDKSNIIRSYNTQPEGSKKNEEFLFEVDKNINSFILIRKKGFIKKIDYYFWYVVNSDSNNIGITNDDYYLLENDIIKIGSVKYIVREIKIRNQKNKNDEINHNLKVIDDEDMEKEFLSLNPPVLDCKKCEDCGCLMVKICECHQFEHFKCIKKYINENLIIRENSKKAFRYYIYKCEECNTCVPLKFKLDIKESFEAKLNNDDKEPLKFNKDEDKLLYFIEINKPNDCDYLLLESFEYVDCQNSRAKKSIHIIKLTEEEDIKIGSDKQNDVIVDHSFVCPKHAIIKYHNGKLLLKNLSKTYGTSVFIPKFEINITQKKISLQIDKIFLEAQVIIKQDSNEEGDTK